MLGILSVIQGTDIHAGGELKFGFSCKRPRFNRIALDCSFLSDVAGALSGMKKENATEIGWRMEAQLQADFIDGHIA